MKSIPLTQGKFAQVDDDLEWLSELAWHYKNGYAVHSSRQPDGSVAKIRMHRLIADTPDGMETDHIDGDGLNNQRDNLRVCSHSDNQHNTGKRADNTSGYKGVFWQKDCRKWKAQIRNGTEVYYLGLFDSSEEAARKYDEAALSLHGKFSHLNFPLEA